MVVGVLTTSYPRFPGDCAGSFVSDDVGELQRRGDSVEVIAAGDGPAGVTRTLEGAVAVTRIGTGGSTWPSLFYSEGAPEVLERGGMRSWLQALHFAGALGAAARAAAARWDTVVSHWLVPCGLVATMAVPALNHRSHAHSGDVALLERLPFGGALARRLAHSGTELVFASSDLQQRFAALAGASPGRDVGTFGSVRRLRPDARLFHRATGAARAIARRQLGVDGPMVISTGRLVPIKGFDVLLDAMGPLAEIAEVVILGAGPEHAPLRERARRRRVSLRLPGVVPRDQVARWLAAADLYVQPSRALPSGRTEGLPVATLEALAVGLPVIVARSGGLAELDQDPGRVWFCEPDNVDSLRRALSSALRPDNRG